MIFAFSRTPSQPLSAFVCDGRKVSSPYLLAYNRVSL